MLIKAQFTKTTSLARQHLKRHLGKSVRIIDGRLTDEDISALFRMSNVYLSLQGAERFGLTRMEAL